MTPKGSDKRVADAWRLYLDHLTTTVNLDDQAVLTNWSEKGNDLLIELLFEMSQALKFGFDKVSLKNGIYSPRAHGELETEQQLLRKFLLELMEGKRAMWTGIITGERPIQMQLVLPPQPAQPPVQTMPPAAPPAGAPGEPQAR